MAPSPPPSTNSRLAVLLSCAGLCLLQFQLHGAAGTAISGAAAGLQMGGSTATLGLSGHSRTNYIMGHRSLDMRSPGKSNQQLANTIKLGATAPSMNALKMNLGAGDFGDFQASNLEQEEQIQLEQLAGLNEIAPPECYDNLFKRFKRWNMRFKRAQEESRGAIKETAGDLIERAFEEVGQRLFQEECEPGTEGWSDGLEDAAESANQMSDFIYKTLNNIVNNLDNILNKYSQFRPFVDELINWDDKSVDTAEEKVMSLLNRLKDRAIDYAVKQIKIKLNGAYQKKALEVGSQFLVDAAGYPGDPMSYIWAMRQAYYSNSLGKVQDLMSNMQFRGAISFINHQNPMPFMRCKPKKKEQEPYC